MFTHPCTLRRPSRGFTLIELLVVIGILAVIAAILLPVISMVRREGGRTAQATALNSIAQALEAYKADFGDYPRFDTTPHSSSPNSDALNDSDYRGAQLLARALFGPAPREDNRQGEELPPAASVTRDDLLEAFQDGHDGFGFKSRRQIISVPEGSTYYVPGKTYGPYLEPERWSFGIIEAGEIALAPGDISEEPTVMILDRNDMPILYYPAVRKTPDIYNGTGFVSNYLADERPLSLYNAADNIGAVPEALLRIMLGDIHDGSALPADPTTWSPDGRINEGETAATTGPYLLITTGERTVRDAGGADYFYGPNSVANFTPAAPDITRIP